MLVSIDHFQLSGRIKEVKQRRNYNRKRLGHDTPIIIATKNGIGEIVRDILHFFLMAIHDVNSKGKNLMLLACLASCCNSQYRWPWLDPSVVLQMQWEIKWYEFIKNSMPKYLLNYQNDKGRTPEETFREEHKELVKSDTEWLNKASKSCTIVATLMAMVAFATSASVPGSVNGKNGEPILKQQRMFEVFAISSLVALCFSLTTVALHIHGFYVGIILGGHFFVLKDVLRDAWIAEYLVVFLPITIFTMAQLLLYTKLLFGTIKKVAGNDLVVSN
ncbi:hypothetical protein ACSBR1_032650 [Camellia fascicularis]